MYTANESHHCETSLGGLERVRCDQRRTRYLHSNEWDEFKKLDYEKIFENMRKPAFVFDGRNVVDAEKLRKIGFIVYSIGKPLDQWLKDMPALA